MNKLVTYDALKRYDGKIKEYVDSQSGGGGGDGLADVELFMDERSIYLRAKPGVIKSGDGVEFRRYVKNKFRRKVESHRFSEYKYRGWIPPGASMLREMQEIGFGFTWTIARSTAHTIKGYELYEIKVGSRTVTAWQGRRDSYLGTFPEKNILSLAKKCGIALVRGGQRITPYMEFKVVLDYDCGYVASRW